MADTKVITHTVADLKPSSGSSGSKELFFEQLLPSDVTVYRFAPDHLHKSKSVKTEGLPTFEELVAGREPSSQNCALQEKTVEVVTPLSQDQVQAIETMEEQLTQDPECQKTLDLLSQHFGYRVSPVAVLILFFDCLKLMIKSREQEKFFRRDEREQMIAQMQKVVDNFKTQAKWVLTSSLGSGVLMIVSGAAPIAGHTSGDFILGKLQGIFSPLKGMEKDLFFKNVAKMTYAMGEMYKSTGQIQNTFSEGDRNKAQHLNDMARLDSEECTRTLEEIMQEWRAIENFLNHQLQTDHETVRALYN